MKTVYVDTSVFGGCFENEFAEFSNKLFREFISGGKRMMYSKLVIDELSRAAPKIKDKTLDVPGIHSILASTPTKAWGLARRYITEGALRYNDMYDALHIATATLQSADIIASWNFKHMVNAGKIKRYNLINKDMGYRMIDIKTPREILNP